MARDLSLNSKGVNYSLSGAGLKIIQFPLVSGEDIFRIYREVIR